MMDSCRIEKAFRHFGHDITEEDHVLEAGLGFAVKTTKPDFIGRDAVLRKRDEGLNTRLVQFMLTDPEPLLFHNEPVIRDGKIVSYVTSANYGHTLGGAIGMSYIPCKGQKPEEVLASSYEIEIAGVRVKAEASLKPMYDPTSRKGESMNLAERHKIFWDLHQKGTFVIPNPWDMGSARMMAGLGAKALATTSAGFAFTLGRPDMGRTTRDENLAHAEAIVAATALPVSGDFENGFADDPDGVAETVRLAGEVGLSGCSIEDTQMVEGNPAYGFDIAVDRIRAAVDAARSLNRPFVLCARADGVMNGVYDVSEAIRRIKAFETAGADLLYVPLPPTLDDLKTIIGSVSKPVNALVAGSFRTHSVADFAAVGVRRISLGSQIARLTHRAINDATREMLGEGTFNSLKNAMSGGEVDQLLAKGALGEKA